MDVQLKYVDRPTGQTVSLVNVFVPSFRTAVSAVDELALVFTE